MIKKIVALLLAVLIPINVWAAFSTGANWINRSVKASSATWSTTTSAAISSGAGLIMTLGTDNYNTTDADHSEHTSVTVDGQSMTKIAEYTNGEGAAGDGATTSVWYLQNSAAVSTGATVSITLANSVTAKVASGFTFTMNNSNTLTVESTKTFGVCDACNTPSLSLTGLTSREYLWVYSYSGEYGDATFTASSGWTGWVHTAATGGPGASRYQGGGQFLVATATGQSSIQPSTDTGRDWAAHLVALYEDSGGPTPTPAARRIIRLTKSGQEYYETVSFSGYAPVPTPTPNPFNRSTAW